MKATHNLSRSRVYRIWRGMLNRCENPKQPHYARYGGKGIKVCERWHRFEDFFDDMGHPEEYETLDRIDSSKDYEPLNCKWSTYKEQNRNRSDNHNITFGGKTQCVQAWANELGVKRSTLAERLKNWTVERALTTRKLR